MNIYNTLSKASKLMIFFMLCWFFVFLNTVLTTDLFFKPTVVGIKSIFEHTKTSKSKYGTETYDVIEVVDLVNPDLLSSATDIASNVLEGAGSVAEAAGTGVVFVLELLGDLG